MTPAKPFMNALRRSLRAAASPASPPTDSTSAPLGAGTTRHEWRLGPGAGHWSEDRDVDERHAVRGGEGAELTLELGRAGVEVGEHRRVVESVEHLLRDGAGRAGADEGDDEVGGAERVGDLAMLRDGRIVEPGEGIEAVHLEAGAGEPAGVQRTCLAESYDRRCDHARLLPSPLPCMSTLWNDIRTCQVRLYDNRPEERRDGKEGRLVQRSLGAPDPRATSRDAACPRSAAGLLRDAAGVAVRRVAVDGP
jgi:hypothetical protein